MTTIIENYTVYMHISPSGKRYIGITSQTVEQRWRNGKGYKSNQPFYNAIKKYGWDNIEHIIVADGLSLEQATDMERRLISEYQTQNKRFGYNICAGGEDGWIGVHHTEQAKVKMSLAKKGKPSNRAGQKLSDETKKKLSESHKGKYRGKPVQPKEPKAKYDENGKRIFSDEHKRKISEKLKGIERSAEVRLNMSKAQVKTKKPVMCIDTGEKFESVTDASKRFNIGKTLIVRVCKGQNQTAKGLKFEYINKGESNV